MIGRRLLPLLAGLWASAAFGQTSITPAKSIPIDGGAQAFARAYAVTAGGVDYVMTGSGASLQVWDQSGIQLAAPGSPLDGSFQTFAVANGMVIGSTTTTLVVAADRNCPISTTVCLAAYAWDPTNGFVLLGLMSTNVLIMSAMALDTQSLPIRVYWVGQNPQVLNEQDMNILNDGGVDFPTTGNLATPVNTAAIDGLTVDTADAGQTLFFSGGDIVYTIPAALSSSTTYATPTSGQYNNIEGIYFLQMTAASYLLGGGLNDGVLVLDPFNPSSPFVKAVEVISPDGGPARVSAVSSNPDGTLLMASENLSGATGNVPWLHLITGFTFDGGNAPVQTDAGGGNPHIPVVPPGPGLNIAPGGCSTTAGIAPFVLALLVPLVVRRRRR